MNINTNTYYEGEIVDMFPFLHKNEREKEFIPESAPKSESNEQNIINELSLKIDQLAEKLEKNNSKGKRKSVIETCTFILALFAAFGSFFTYLDLQFTNIDTKIDKCLTSENITDLVTSVDKIELWVYGDINDKNKPGASKRVNDIEDDISEIKNGVNEINNVLNISAINTNDSVVMNNLIYITSMENVSSQDHTLLTLDTYLGKDKNGNKYNIGNVIDDKVLLTYSEDDREVYFYGQINKKLHWAGHCVTNAYNTDGTLYGVCESNFDDDGIRLDYESFYLSDTKDTWIYTKRTCGKDGNLGISQTYSFKNDKIKNFTNTNVRVYDMLYIKDFNNSNNKTLTSYYFGLTQNGKYEDNTGEAYLIKYFDPDDIYVVSDKPVIKLLYQGKFVGGYPSDQGYDSWSISREPDTTYMFYRGGFLDGKSNSRDTGKEEFENYLTHDRIDYYLDKYGFSSYSEQFVTEYEH